MLVKEKGLITRIQDLTERTQNLSKTITDRDKQMKDSSSLV